MYQAKNKSLKCIDLLRHGETTAGHCFIGSTDTLLTATGWQQMHAAVVNQDYDLVVSSPLKRCIEFAQRYSVAHGISCIAEPDYREYDFGEWEGKSSEALWETDRSLLSAFWDNPYDHAPPGAESMQIFRNRVTQAFESHMKMCEAENILLIAHGGVIRQLLVSQLNISWSQAMNIRIGHGQRLRLVMTDNGFILLSMNECELI